jgi:hypothetical protein
MKLTLVLCLFGSVALADGDMGSGNLNCPPQGCPPPCTQNCIVQTADDGTEAISDEIIAGTDMAVDFVNDTLGLF